MTNENKEYVIVADFLVIDETRECLVRLAGSNKEQADEILERMINNPTEDDIKLIKNGKNLRLKEVESKDCWWNYGTN